MQTLNAIYENGVFRPLELIDMPNACIVKIQIQPQPKIVQQFTLTSLVEISNRFPINPELPEDLAAQHDHYLYGLPKQL